MADHYEAEVNKGDINMSALTRDLNKRHEDGWRLAHLVPSGDNTILIWEKRA